MRVAFPVIALTLAAGAAAETPQTAPPRAIVMPTEPGSLTPPPGLEGRVPCRDTIHQVREARGLPREAPSEPPQLIAAVDHRINGCSVLVMYDNTADVRPLPAMPEGPPKLERIPAP